MKKYRVGQVLKLTHESGNEYVGEVVERDGKLFAKTKFFNWHIELNEKLHDSRSSWFKCVDIVGEIPQDSFMLDLPPETLELYKCIREGKFNDKKWADEWKKGR